MFWLPILLPPLLSLPIPGLPLSPQSPATREWTHSAGTIFELDHPPGWRVSENGNGRAYTLELRPAGAGPDAPPALRITAPETGEVVEAEDWLAHVLSELENREEAAGKTPTQREDLSVEVLGALQPGLRILFQGPDGQRDEDLLCSFRCCSHAVAVVARLEEPGDLDRARRILASLKGHEWGPRTLIPRRVGGIDCAIPVLATVSHPPTESADLLRADLPGYRLELKVRDCPARGPASGHAALVAGLHALESELRASTSGQGSGVFRRMTRWMGNGVILGFLHGPAHPASFTVEEQVYLTRVGSQLLEISAQYPASAREGAGASLQSVLDSLNPEATDSWEAQTFVGHGFSLPLNERLPVQIQDLLDGHRFEIRPLSGDPAPFPLLSIDLNRGQGPPPSVQELLARSAAQRLPGWKLDPPREVVADVLGNSALGLLATAHRGEDRARICQFLFPFGERRLSACLICSPEEGQAEFSLLSHLLRGIRNLRNSDPIPYRDAEIGLTLDPELWTLRSLDDSEGRVVELRTGKLRMRLRTRPSRRSTAPTPPQGSAPAAGQEPGLERALAEMTAVMDQTEGNENVQPAAAAAFLFRNCGGLLFDYFDSAADETREAHSVLLAERARDWLEIRVDAPATDLADRERAAEILDGMVIQGAVNLPSHVVRSTHFQITVPESFHAQPIGAETKGLLISSPLSGAPTMVVTLVPRDQVDIDEEAMMAEILERTGKELPDDDSEEIVNTPLLRMGPFLTVGKRLIATLPDGGVQITDAYAFHDDDYQYRIIIHGNREGVCDAGVSLRRILASLTPIER